MRTGLIDRLTATPVFRTALLFASLAVMPVLALGVLTTVVGGSNLLAEGRSVDLAQAVFALLSLGGALGFIGYARAHAGARKPDRHGITATLICLAAGVLTALVVAGSVIASMIADWGDAWSGRAWLSLPALFALANLVWATSGIAWSQRLRRRYVEITGQAFDGLPALLLFVALTLAVAAAATTITL